MRILVVYEFYRPLSTTRELRQHPLASSNTLTYFERNINLSFLLQRLDQPTKISLQKEICANDQHYLYSKDILKKKFYFKILILPLPILTVALFKCTQIHLYVQLLQLLLESVFSVISPKGFLLAFHSVDWGMCCTVYSEKECFEYERGQESKSEFVSAATDH